MKLFRKYLAEARSTPNWNKIKFDALPKEVKSLIGSVQKNLKKKGVITSTRNLYARLLELGFRIDSKGNILQKMPNTGKLNANRLLSTAEKNALQNDFKKFVDEDPDFKVFSDLLK